MALEDIAKDVPSPDVLDLAPHRREHLLDQLVLDQALPEYVVLINVVLEIIVHHGAVVPPGVTSE